MLCTGHREFGTNRWRFLLKVNTSYFRSCNICEFMMCILIVNHQFHRMHPWCSWEGTLPGRCSPGKRCHTFWNRNIVLLPILLGIGVKRMELSRISQKVSMLFIFGVPSWLYIILNSVLWRVLQNLKPV